MGKSDTKERKAVARAEREEQEAREAFNALAARAARRSIEIKALEAVQKEDTDRLKALIGSKVYKKFRVDATDTTFTMLTKQFRRINEKRAAELYGERVMELKVTSDAVKRAGLTEAQVNELYDETTAIQFEALS